MYENLVTLLGELLTSKGKSINDKHKPKKGSSTVYDLWRKNVVSSFLALNSELQSLYQRHAYCFKATMKYVGDAPVCMLHIFLAPASLLP